MNDIEPIELDESAEEILPVVDEIEGVETAVSHPTPRVIQPTELELRPKPATTGQRLLMFIVGAVILLLDQISKRFVEANIPLYQSWDPFPAQAEWFRFLHVPNTGVAFGLFPQGGILFATVAVVVSLIIIYYNHTLPKGQMLLRLALGLQIGGALGNLTDRLRIGHVTDFIDVGPIPIFNVADMAVVTGAIVLALVVLLESREQKAQAKIAKSERLTAVSNQPDSAQTSLPEPMLPALEKPETTDEWSTP